MSLRLLVWVCLMQFAVLSTAQATLIETGRGSKTQDQRVPKELSDGFAALEKNDLPVAEAAFKSFLAKNPSSAAAIVGLADVSLRRNKTGEAEQQLVAALAASPNDSLLLGSLGRLKLLTGDFDAGQKYLEQAIAADKSNVHARADLGDLYLRERKQPVKASEIFRAALKEDPKYTRAQMGLGMALAANGSKTEALAAFNDAAKADPLDATPHFAMGRIYAEQKAWDQAVQEFSTTLKLDPTYILALGDRANVAAQLGRYQAAAADYEALLKVTPEDPQTMLKLGLVYESLQRYADAERMYLAALKANPNFSLAYNNLAYRAAEQKKNLDQALTWAKRAVELSPDVPHFQDTLGWVYHARGQNKEALATLEKAIAMPPPQAGAYYHLGVVYQDGGNITGARDAFAKALRTAPDFKDASDAKRRLAALK
jgi:tetratricopeptide (TPR) repeat protein